MFDCFKHSFKFKHEEFYCPVCELLDGLPSQKDFSELEEKIEDLECDVDRLCDERDGLESTVLCREDEIERLWGVINEMQERVL